MAQQTVAGRQSAHCRLCSQAGSDVWEWGYVRIQSLACFRLQHAGWQLAALSWPVLQQLEQLICTLWSIKMCQ